jgi:transposase-like protein
MRMIADSSSAPSRRRPTADWLSITQYADAYGVHRQTVRKWIDHSQNGGAKILITWQIGTVVRIKNLPPSS